MGNDAPDARAQALANKILGKPPSDSAVADLIAGKVSVGKRDEDGRPVGESIPAEEYRARSDKPARRAPKRDEDTSDVDEYDNTPDGDDEEEDDTDYEEGGDEEDSDDDADEGSDESDDEEGDDDEEDGEDYEEVTYSDDDLIEVKVDGEIREVSLSDLKRAYSLAGATEKRLAEATETRNAAQAEKELVAQEVQKHRVNMLRTIQQLDSVLFAPLVEEPDPKLRAKNMQEYLLQKDAFEEDQKRIAAARGELTQFLAGEHQKINEDRQLFRQSQQQLLAQKMPDLLDPAKTQKIQTDILNAAVHYGFSPEQVAEVDHHGLFLMARDASRWLNMQKLKKAGKVPTDGESTTVRRRKRHLKPGGGGAVSTKTRLVRSNKEQVAAMKKAQSTGSVDDVAQMLMSKARTRGKPNGRRG